MVFHVFQDGKSKKTQPYRKSENKTSKILKRSKVSRVKQHIKHQIGHNSS